MKRYKLTKIKKRKRGKKPKRKQRGGLFGFEYLMNELAGRRQDPNNSIVKFFRG